MVAMKLYPERGEIHEPIGVSSRFADPSLHSSRVSQSARSASPTVGDEMPVEYQKQGAAGRHARRRLLQSLPLV